MLADSGQIREWVAIGSDISDRKQAEQKVQELNQILEQRVIERTAQLAAANESLQGAKTAAETASRAKSQFLANMSHELRTPLNGILGYTQLLLKDSHSQIQRERLAIVQQCGEHLLDLVNDLLSLAKIEAQKLELYSQPLHLPTFLQGVADMCCLSATSKQLQWCYDAAEIDSLNAWVLADDKRLRQVLLNLLSNAIKYTESGGITLQVNLLSQTQERLFLKFRVTDTGIGIASDEIERIFQPFEQGDVCWQRHIEGTGLGLAISQRLVQLMGSQLQVTSELGRGSTFWFDLELPLSLECYLPQENSQENQFIVGVAKPAPRILVAEPLDRERLILVNFLDSLGFLINTASDSAILQDKVTVFEPQLLVVAEELLSLEPAIQSQLHQQLQAQEVKMITLATKELAEPNQPLVAASDAFLSKPIRFQRLLDTISELLPIEWIYANPTTKIYPKFVALSASAGYARDKNSLIPPPPAELERFYKLAYKGDIKGLREQAAQLEQEPCYGEFARTILTLARNFQEKEIRQLIDRFRQ
ncbi:MAG: hybrid sensor histidine kinase/response regulator [Chloroflexaceae bacterium]|nr:hybrid sensor histidine kinase/response regulator [Chloroflexaceae bacterium]